MTTRYYVGLLLVPGDPASEPKAPEYRRHPVRPLRWLYPTADGNYQVANHRRILFPTAQRPWGLVLGLAVYDAPEGGHALECGTVTPCVNILPGQIRGFEAGDLEFPVAGRPRHRRRTPARRRARPGVRPRKPVRGRKALPARRPAGTPRRGPAPPARRTTPTTT